jgi:hypothetical protein
VAAVRSFATILSQVIQEAGLNPLSRIQLERMIDTVIADGGFRAAGKPPYPALDIKDGGCLLCDPS